MKIRILALIVLLASGIAAYSLWPRHAANGALVLYGNVDIREVQLGFRVGGRLQTMNFEEGDTVTAGTLLATLDAQPMEDGLALAEAGVAEAEAHLALLRKGSRPQEIQQAKAHVDEITAALENARREYTRQKDLTESGLSSQELLDASVARRDQLSARLAASQEALAIALEGARLEEISAAEAALAAARAQRAMARTQLEDTQLRAPNNGVVLTRVHEPGSIVAAGAPVYALSLTDTIYVRAYVDETSLGRVVPGARVAVNTDSSSKEYPGQVGFISPRAEFTPKSVETLALRTDLVYRLRVVITEPDEGLRQGMPVTVKIPAS